jgi:hypoxanthine phosphoribosyltransferase
VLNVSLRDHADTPDLHTLEKVYAWQKRVLIVDDINDTGATFNYIMNNFGKPERLKFAVILHNTVSTYKDIDYKGYEINKLEDPRWIVFPWEQW